MKKIVFIIPSLIAGGAERVLVNLIIALNKYKYKIFIILLEDISSGNPLEGLGEYEIVCLKKRGRWDVLRLIFDCGYNIRKNNPEVIVSVLWYSSLITLLALSFCGIRKRVILWEHSIPTRDLKHERFSSFKMILMRFLYRHADKVVTVSKEVAREFIEYFALPSNKVVTIYNPVPVQAIIVKARWAVDHPFIIDDEYLIISAGRLERVKRFDKLLRILALLRSRAVKVKLIIAGKGNLESELRELARELMIDDHVDFIGFREDVYAWIAKADLFVLTSDYEGFPMVILESMVCGTPVISSNFSGVTEIIEDGKTGLIIDKEDVAAFTEAVIMLLGNEKLRKEMSENGVAYVQNLSSDRLVARFEELFD